MSTNSAVCWSDENKCCWILLILTIHQLLLNITNYVNPKIFFLPNIVKKTQIFVPTALTGQTYINLRSISHPWLITYIPKYIDTRCISHKWCINRDKAKNREFDKKLKVKTGYSTGCSCFTKVAVCQTDYP